MLELVTTAILEQLQDSEEFKAIDRRIFTDETKINEENFDLCCKIFSKTSEEYFRLGFKACFSLITDCR